MKFSRPTGRFAILVPNALLLALTVGCAGQLASTNPPPIPSPAAQPTPTQVATASPVPTPVLTPSPSPTVAPSPTADTSAPPELLGRWQTTLANGDLVYLTLSAHAYIVDREGAVGGGRTDVIGDEIKFSQGSLCDALGRYGWSVVDDTLTFDVLQEGCPGRLQVIGPTTYTKP